MDCTLGLVLGASCEQRTHVTATICLCRVSLQVLVFVIGVLSTAMQEATPTMNQGTSNYLQWRVAAKRFRFHMNDNMHARPPPQDDTLNPIDSPEDMRLDAMANPLGYSSGCVLTSFPQNFVGASRSTEELWSSPCSVACGLRCSVKGYGQSYGAFCLACSLAVCWAIILLAIPLVRSSELPCMSSHLDRSTNCDCSGE